MLKHPGTLSFLLFFALLSPAWAAKEASKAPSPKIFETTGCTQCHGFAAYHLEGGTTGPDLSNAKAVVKKRYGMSLNAFLKAPKGNMKEVLGSMIHLSPRQRETIVALLDAPPAGVPKKSK
jgi:mono/diheme cytochrome c family protein